MSRDKRWIDSSFFYLNLKDDLKKAAKLEYQEFLRKQVQFKLSVEAGKTNIYAYVIYYSLTMGRVMCHTCSIKVLVAANFECRKLFPTFSYSKAYKICLIVAKLVCTSFL